MEENGGKVKVAKILCHLCYLVQESKFKAIPFGATLIFTWPPARQVSCSFKWHMGLKIVVKSLLFEWNQYFDMKASHWLSSSSGTRAWHKTLPFWDHYSFRNSSIPYLINDPFKKRKMLFYSISGHRPNWSRAISTLSCLTWLLPELWISDRMPCVARARFLEGGRASVALCPLGRGHGQ